ncbi:MAG: ModE family transcriptional regulator [Deltaproteobacteria bacterium RIFOXYD12_FULL_50_9]|nr:MAG: ModE family transcriptional regulator [Deltaproteobacteria bacterium RIFOXYD12_FULL_50_9]
MTIETSGFVIQSKIWIDDSQGMAVFGPGRYRILEAVDRLQSLQAAAKELKMSYRAVWCRIKASEERLGKTLVIREGRGSRLTPFARELMTAFLGIQTRVREESDAAFANLMSNSLKSKGI